MPLIHASSDVAVYCPFGLYTSANFSALRPYGAIQICLLLLKANGTCSRTVTAFGSKQSNRGCWINYTYSNTQRLCLSPTKLLTTSLLTTQLCHIYTFEGDTIHGPAFFLLLPGSHQTQHTHVYFHCLQSVCAHQLANHLQHHHFGDDCTTLCACFRTLPTA